MWWCCCFGEKRPPAVAPINEPAWTSHPFIHEYTKYITLRHDLHAPNGARVLSLTFGPEGTNLTHDESLRYLEKTFTEQVNYPQVIQDAFENFSMPLPENTIALSFGWQHFQPTELPHMFHAPSMSGDEYILFKTFLGKNYNAPVAAFLHASWMRDGYSLQTANTYFFEPVRGSVVLPVVEKKFWTETSSQRMESGYTWIKYKKCNEEEVVEVNHVWENEFGDLQNPAMHYPPIPVINVQPAENDNARIEAHEEVAPVDVPEIIVVQPSARDDRVEVLFRPKKPSISETVSDVKEPSTAITPLESTEVVTEASSTGGHEITLRPEELPNEI